MNIVGDSMNEKVIEQLEKECPALPIMSRNCGKTMMNTFMFLRRLAYIEVIDWLRHEESEISIEEAHRIIRSKLEDIYEVIRD